MNQTHTQSFPWNAPSFGRLVGAVGQGPRRWDYRPNGYAYSRTELAHALLWLRRVARTHFL